MSTSSPAGSPGASRAAGNRMGAAPRRQFVRARHAAIGLAALGLYVLYGSSGALAGHAPRPTPPPDLSLPEIAQNVLLYIPFGILSVWTLRAARLRQTAVYVWVFALAVAYSSVMELLQRLFAARIASPLDVVSNVSGALVGAIAADRTEHGLALGIYAVRRTGLLAARARYLLAAVLVIIAIAAWYPFDVTLDISTLSERTRAVRIDPWQWPTSRSVLLSQAARFFVVAAVMAACFPGLAGRAAPVAAAAAAMLALVIDLGQLAMGSQPIGVAAWLSQAAGGCAGAGAAFVVTFALGTRYAAA